ncbi:hypothetical protein MMC22_006682 [Lobaria immixta]|nr:hypothetical protein [Lobaria immixta]
MTPSKTKKALPSSTSVTFPEHPITLPQWKTALQRVKLLYLKGRLKECSAQCSLLLSEVNESPHPLHTSCLHFYLALSTEGISRLTHNLSTAKIQLLKQARGSYQAAALSLPVVESTTESHEYLDDEASSESASTSASTPRAALSIPSPTRPSSPAYSSSPSSFDLYSPYSNEFDDVPQPSPLRIRKAIHPCSLLPVKNLSIPTSKTLPCSPPPTPPSTTITFTSSTATWLQTRAYHRFSSQLASFAEMLTGHIAVVDDLLVVAEETQANRHAKRLPSYGADDETRAEDRKWRIARLREQGWRRQRFQPERYAALCERALEELY